VGRGVHDPLHEVGEVGGVEHGGGGGSGCGAAQAGEVVVRGVSAGGNARLWTIVGERCASGAVKW
jgi:hypothetical protein